MLDSLLKADFSKGIPSGHFSILLPTAINTQVDYAMNQRVYLNLSAHLTNFYSTLYKVHNFSAICFAPRFEHYWFNISVPVTFNALSAKRFEYIAAGLNIRLGPLSVGTNNLGAWGGGDLKSLNLYAILKFSVPYKLIRDQDQDGVIDRKDHCPDDPGVLASLGCPDKDKDNVPDKDDACPGQPGLALNKGCPDSDGDGVADREDACPAQKGVATLYGCPDTDHDSIIDKEDACPDSPGLKKFKGCPDTDLDGIVDPDDPCPLARGVAKYHGCPDTDGDGVHDGIDLCREVPGPFQNKGCPWRDSDNDGVIDKQDSCVNTPGVAAFKGCPPPVRLAPTEKRIVQKAYATLEFEAGKDIIRRSSYPSLDALARMLMFHKSEWQLKLSGHTDNEGTNEDNLRLSEMRTRAVQGYLVKQGIPEGNIIVEWFGESRQISENTTLAGRQKNRRVEMTILMKVE
jgi:outer membrane protein OmpA-like peptidoglycan-associated protein